MPKEYIERDKILPAIEAYIELPTAYENIEREIGDIPAADVAPVVHGEWEYYTHTMMACSICKRHVPRHKSEYCPHCGAKMDGGEK